MANPEITNDDFQRLVQREMHKLLLKLFRARFLIVILLVAFFFAFLYWDPVAWKLILITSSAILMAAGFLFEYKRVLKSGSSTRTIQVNFLFMLIIQTIIIFVTGGIQSPLLIIYVPLCLGVGLLLGEFRKALPVIITPVVMVFLFAAECIYGWIPHSLPSFFELGLGLRDKPIFVWSLAVATATVIIAAGFISTTIRRIMENQIRQSFNTRQKALDSLANRNREILSVSSTIAHELKNPLASIKGLAQLLARQAKPETKDYERLEVMQSEIERMSTILEEFRSFTRPLSGLSLELCQMADIVTDVALLNEGIAEQRGIILEIQENQAIEISCDSHKVKQALLNIVQNAIEATPNDGKITIALKRKADNSASLQVADCGSGVSEHTKEHMFETGFTTKKQGTGIGLKVAKSIIEQHGGSIAIENLPTSGCRVDVIFPATPPKNSGEIS